MKFLIPVVAGAIIGYGTNWLAIKMLFRPYEEKRILGIKVPWTPGLIPKEKPRIAKNVGRTVQDYLLSPDAILKSIDKNNLEKETLKLIDSRFKYLSDEKIRLREVLSLIPNMSRSYDKLKFSIVDEVILSRANKDKVLEYVNTRIGLLLEDEALVDNFLDLLKIRSKDFVNSKEFYNLLDSNLKETIRSHSEAGKLIKDFIPQEVQKEIGVYLDENKNIIGYKIRKFIEKPEIQNKIKETISNFVENNVNPLLATFMPIDIISDKVYKGLENYIKSSDAKNDINEGLKLLLKDLMNTEIKELDSIIKKSNPTDLIVGLINDFDLESLGDLLKSNINTLNKLTPYILKEVNEILNSTGLREFLIEQIDKSYSNLSNMLVIDALDQLEISSENILEVVLSIFENNIIPNFPSMVKHIKVSKIVEETILEFDYEFTEKLILDIAEKELKAITYLGGFLGAGLGFISALFQI